MSLEGGFDSFRHCILYKQLYKIDKRTILILISSLLTDSATMTTQRGEKVKRVEELARSFQQRPLAAHYRPRLCRPWEPSSVWRLFPRQSAALAFAKGCKEVRGLFRLPCLPVRVFSAAVSLPHLQDVHVFALERALTEVGQRIYLVTSYSELWHYYRWVLAPCSRHTCPVWVRTWSRLWIPRHTQSRLAARRTFRHSLMHCYEVIPEGAVCKVYFDLEFHKPSNNGLDGPQMVQLLIQVGQFSFSDGWPLDAFLTF